MSESLNLLLSYPGQVIKRYLTREKFTRVFTVSVLLIIILLIAIAIYAITIGGLNFISRDIELKDALYFYIMQLFALLIFGLSYGNSILVIATSFAKRSHQWIMATPSFSILAFINLFKLLASTLWIFLAVITPILLAIGEFMGLDWVRLLLAFVLTSALIVIASICGILSYLLSIFILNQISKGIGRNIVSQSLAIFILIFTSILMIMFFWKNAIPQDFVRLFEGDFIAQIASLRAQLIYLPTFGIAQVLYDILFCDNVFGTFYVIIFSILTTFLLAIVYMILKNNYLAVWQLLQESNYIADKIDAKSITHRSYNFPSNSVIHTIIDKELLLIWRDKKMYFGF